MKKQLTVAILAAAFVGSPVQAETKITGKLLLKICEEDKLGFCLGYTTGLFEGAITQAISDNTEAFKCHPNDVSNGQRRDIALEYFRGHPESMHLPASVLMWRIWESVWPCK